MLWFPNEEQVILEENDNYFHSLFVGLTAPILLFPKLCWIYLGEPIINGIWNIFMTVVQVQILGLLGQVKGRHLTDDDYIQEIEDMIEDDENDQRGEK